MTKKLLLVGVGDAHLSLLRRLKEDNDLDCEITLLNPSDCYYNSGMYSGFVEGIYELDDLEIDLKQLSVHAGIRFMKGKALSIDAKQKMVLTDEGDIITFDFVSFDLGTRRKGTDILPRQAKIVHLNDQEHIKIFQNDDRKKGDIVVVGHATEGIELSLALKSWKKQHQEHGEVTIISEGEIYPKADAKCQRKLRSILGKANIKIIENEQIVDLKDDSVLTGKTRLPYDTLLWMTDPEAPKMFKSSKLPTDENGYLLVEDTLQVKQYPFIFGAGNSVTIRNQSHLLRNSVMAVRQGEVLWDNLKGYLHSGEGFRFEPPKRLLSILSIGERKGLLLYGSYCSSGRIPWKMKNKIDQTYMKSFM